jgi:4-amino-4-deoxy-L-arabinose transferase-like glycosyltransferase
VTSTRRSDRRAWIALAAIVLLAAALRLVGVRYGLPYPLLNPDEGSIVPRAWRMVHGGGLDPGWFDYPSLFMYLEAPLQAPFDNPSYGAARVVAVAAGLASVLAAWWLGRRAYGTSAGLVGAAAVAVATTHVAYSRMAVTDVLLTLGVTAALALAVSGRLEWAGLAVGLAASAKYPGAIAGVGLLAAGFGEWRRLARAAALAAAAFALTSPFVVIRAGAAWDDVSRVQRLARQGWLGFEDDPVAPLAYLDRLWESLGPAALAGLVGLALALARRRRPDLVLASFALAYWLYLMPLAAHFDRYVLPLVPVLGVLAGSTRRLAPVAAALLLLPLAWSARDAVRHGLQADPRLAADAWIAATIPDGDRIAADPSTLPLVGRDVIRLQLPGPGRAFDPRRDIATLRRLAVDWVLVSGGVTDRVLRAREHYPREAAFYDRLAREATVAFARDPESDGWNTSPGPWVRVYRLDG